MDYELKLLMEVEGKIEDLLTRRTELKALKRKSQLDDDGEEELAGMEDTLTELRGSKKHWQEVVIIATKKDAKMEEESFTFEKATRETIEAITGVTIRQIRNFNVLQIDNSVVPSAGFLDQFEKNCRVWSMNSESSLRTFIDLFLRDVVARYEDFGDKMRIFCELTYSVSKDVGNKRQKLGGRVDYNIGHCNGIILDTSPPEDSHLIAVEAKKAWEKEDIWQCIAEVATLHKNRKDARKQNSCVWGILSNGSHWQFIFINNDSQIFQSDEFHLSFPEVDHEKINKIYRCVHYLVKQAYLASPTTSRANTPIQI